MCVILNLCFLYVIINFLFYTETLQKKEFQLRDAIHALHIRNLRNI